MKLEFKKTGFWWTDLGIVALYDSLLALRSTPNIGLTLKPTSLVANGKKKAVQNAIGEARKTLMDDFWGKTRKGKMWWRCPASFFLKQYVKGPSTLPIARDKFEKK